ETLNSSLKLNPPGSLRRTTHSSRPLGEEPDSNPDQLNAPHGPLQASSFSSSRKRTSVFRPVPMPFSVRHCEPKTPGPSYATGKSTGSKTAGSGGAAGSKYVKAATAFLVPSSSATVTSTVPAACGGGVTTKD